MGRLTLRRTGPWAVVGLLAAIAAGVAIYKTLPLLKPPITERAEPSPDCDLREAPCTATFDFGGSVTLSIRPRGIPLLQPLSVQAELRHLPTPSRVELDFAGVDMEMGYNRQPLTASPTEPGRYQGTAILPVCVRDRMTWQATVLIHLPDGLWAAPFRFDAFRRE